MIRSLRSRHRIMISAVAVVAGLLAVLGLLARRPVPTIENLPGVASTTTATVEPVE